MSIVTMFVITMIIAHNNRLNFYNSILVLRSKVSGPRMCIQGVEISSFPCTGPGPAKHHTRQPAGWQWVLWISRQRLAHWNSMYCTVGNTFRSLHCKMVFFFISASDIVWLPPAHRQPPSILSHSKSIGQRPIDLIFFWASSSSFVLESVRSLINVSTLQSSCDFCSLVCILIG